MMYTLEKLHFGTFLKRYKRFFVDIYYNEKIITAHNPNTGSMKGLLVEGAGAAFSTSNNINRKLPYTLEALKINEYWIFTNTIKTNSIVYNALVENEITEFINIDKIKREFAYQDSKIDFFIQIGNRKILIEVKSVSLFDDQYAMFPDSKSQRGKKHLDTLAEALTEGYESYLLYVIQSDRKIFRCADMIDPEYCSSYKKAVESGVNIIFYSNILDTKSETCRLIKTVENLL